MHDEAKTTLNVGTMRIGISQMTRALWAKYSWTDATRCDDTEVMLLNTGIRLPDAAKKAWDEYELFATLHIHD